MHFFFNKLTLLVMLTVVFLFTMSINEVAKFAQSSQFQAIQRIKAISAREVYTRQERCHEATGRLCDFYNCDFVPAGTTLEEICGLNPEKGWRATDTIIPDQLRNVTSIRLTISSPNGTKKLDLSPTRLTMSLTATDADGSVIESRSIPVDQNESTRILTIMVLNDLVLYQTNEPTEASVVETFYDIEITARKTPLTLGPAQELLTRVQCAARNCPQEVMGGINALLSLWPAGLE